MPRLSNAERIKFIVALGIPLVVLLLPSDWIPLDNLTLVQHRLLAIFLLAALFWVLEPVPVFATSILVIALELMLISDKGIYWFTEASAGQNMGELMKYTDIFSAFSSPIIILFMGGFALAIAASKYQLDNNLARVLLKPFGTKPKGIMLGLMLITAVFSMFMSNTATTVMMLALLAPILASFPKGDNAIKALVLCIPLAANTGGIATPIGTPPNAIALQYLTGENAVSFLEWTMIGVPFVIVQLTFAWWLLQKIFPANQQDMTLKLDGVFQKSWRAYTVYFTFAATILLWMTTGVHGMNTYVVAIIPLAIFTLTGIMGKEELKLINWDVLWLVAGGIAIGLALDKTGLASSLAHAVDYDTLSPFAVVVTLSLICWVMANFMSNTATANLLMPIAAAVASSMESLAVVGGIKGLLVVVAFSASLGMILPVSTPPNSLAYSTGLIDSRDMAKVGLLVGVFGLSIVFISLFIFT